MTSKAISHVSEDCAGAVQCVTPERLAGLRCGKEDNVVWLDAADIADRVKNSIERAVQCQRLLSA